MTTAPNLPAIEGLLPVWVVGARPSVATAAWIALAILDRVRGHARPTDVLREATRYLAARGVEGPEATAEALLRYVLRTDRIGLYSREVGLSIAEAKSLSRALCERCTGVPLEYIVGERQFRDLVLATEPGVFIPRPETELLVDAALEAIAGIEAPVVVDVGTVNGAIALSLKQARSDARVIATDVSLAAVTLARRNADRHGLEVQVLRGSYLDPVPDALRETMSLVVSNPPYVNREEYEALPDEVRAEPCEALVGGTKFHTELAELATSWLAVGGWLVVEIGADQGHQVRAIFDRAGLEALGVLPDLAGRDRIARGRRGHRTARVT